MNKVEEILKRFDKGFGELHYVWSSGMPHPHGITHDEKHELVEKQKKKIHEFLTKELQALIDEEREKAVRGFETYFMEIVRPMEKVDGETIIIYLKNYLSQTKGKDKE